MSLTIASHTLGCKLNFAETSHLLRRFASHGVKIVEMQDKADIYVINTCTVTAVAEKKCRTAIRQAIALNPDAIVAVIGCFAQNAPDAIRKIPGVSLVLGNDSKHRLYEEVMALTDKAQAPAADPMSLWPAGKELLAYSAGDRTRTFFKIQDGCDYFCSYCAIPFARGRARNATIAETMTVAREIARTGAKEVVLTGVNTGTFGKDNGEDMLELLRQLDALEGIERYRISSIEPNLITDEMVDFVAQSRHFAHHFHIPLQSGSDVVLKKMHRRYDTAFYREKVLKIKAAMPESCIATDLMVGFHGETDEEFVKACRYVEELPLSYLHVFTYSERPNTLALKMEGKVPVEERRKRSETMHRISERKRRTFYEENYGREQVVLWEGDLHEGNMLGWTDNYIRVFRPYDPALINSLEKVILSKDNTIFIQ